jgi:hypothetical protein
MVTLYTHSFWRGAPVCIDNRGLGLNREQKVFGLVNNSNGNLHDRCYKVSYKLASM